MTEKAVAIKYREDLPAPFLVAKGRDKLAERIVALAKEHGVQVIAQPELADRLFVLETGTFIRKSVSKSLLIFSPMSIPCIVTGRR